MKSKIVVSKFYPNGLGSNFLQELRGTVSELKIHEPELNNYHLEDLGFVKGDQGLEVKLYFALN